MRLTAPIQLLVIALTAQSSASPLAAPESSDIESRDFTEFTSDTAALGKRSYQNSCQRAGCRADTNGNNPYMECSCRNKSGKWATTRLYLNGCITNRNGVMQWSKNGNFGKTCNSVRLSRRVEENRLEASCYGPNGAVFYSYLELNGRIHNQNGVLAC